MALHGGCLCGGVRYEINGKLENAGNCHCSMCRKNSGSAFIAAAQVAAKDFKWTKGGEGALGSYASSPGGKRMFCRNCGSPLACSSESMKDSVFLFLGSLDDDPGVRPESHFFVGSKAPWYEITDQLPQFKEFPS
jgi:hypothetical protein